MTRTTPHIGKTTDLARRLSAEFLGTALLVTVVVGSGIAAERLSPDDVGLQLLENSTATAFGLTVLILLSCLPPTGSSAAEPAAAYPPVMWPPTRSRRSSAPSPVPSSPT